MTGGSHIAAIGPDAKPDETQGQAEITAEETTEFSGVFDAEEVPEGRDLGWIAPALFLLAILGWTGFFGWAYQGELMLGGTPQEWIGWITAWVGPVLLIIGMWLLLLRTSRREAHRFGNVARRLSDESALLQSRLVVVNRELSLAREFIAAQSRDLESLGRVASERLSVGADRLAGLIHENTAQIESIASVSTVALENMDKLRGDLPVIANSARDVTSQIGNAGRTAHAQLEELVAGFHRLNTFGEASERQVESLGVRINAALREFEAHAAELAKTQAEALSLQSDHMASLHEDSKVIAQSLHQSQHQSEESWQRAITAMQEAIEETQARIAEVDAAALERAQRQINTLAQELEQLDAGMEERAGAFVASMEERRILHAQRETESIADLEQRMAALDSAIAERQAVQLIHVSALASRGEDLSAKLEALNSHMDTIVSRGGHVSSELSQAVETLSSQLASNKAVLETTETAIAGLTEASVRLLELIHASATHSSDKLPQAINQAQHSLEGFEEKLKAANLVLSEAQEKGESLSQYVLATRKDSVSALEELSELQKYLTESGSAYATQIEEQRMALVQLSKDSEKLSQKAQGELSDAIERLHQALQQTLNDLEGGATTAVATMAAHIGDQSAEAIDRAVRLRTAEAIGELEQSAAHASGVSREAARQLRDQLAKVDELASNLENRVQRARERAEEQVNNDFSRRMALITESLNSNAIDIAKVLSNDITDTAWASYLRGDRGIFTRRAVRLLDNSEAREISEMYVRDNDFQEHVSRYIHDFEAMLRTVLSTRDGHVLGVTLLSSDMGKLYVALAQAIERLRD